MACEAVYPQRKAEQCDLGPLLTLEPDLEHFLGEPAVTQGAEGGANCLKSPLWRTTKSGWSGEAASSTHPDWWEELVAIPKVNDHCRLTWKVHLFLRFLR